MRPGATVVVLVFLQLLMWTTSVTRAPVSASTRAILVMPLTGSNQALVYGEYTSMDISNSSLKLVGIVVRHADGTEQRLPSPVSGGESWEGWSMSRTTVTALERPTTVHWWDVAVGTSGVLSIPQRKSYVGAAPGGVMYVSKTGRLTFKNFAGVTTAWAKVLGGRPRIKAVKATSSGNGVVVSDPLDGPVAYVAFADPQVPVRLVRVGSTMCWTATAHFAACTTHRTGRPDRGELLPLDGSRPTPEGDRSDHFGPVTISGAKTLVWAHDRPMRPSSQVGCRKAGQRHASFGGRPLEWPLVRGLGHAVTSTPDLHRLEIITKCPAGRKLPPPLPLP